MGLVQPQRLRCERGLGHVANSASTPISGR
jgi:hypothetical protein